MILISHRGNTAGSMPERENNPDYIIETIEMGFEVEIDVWCVKDALYLGHDAPQYEISESFLMNDNLWCHAKNLEALSLLLKIGAKCFWHENDDFTLTSTNKIWTYPNKQVKKNSIIVCKNIDDTIRYYKLQIFGICSDFIGDLK